MCESNDGRFKKGQEGKRRPDVEIQQISDIMHRGRYRFLGRDDAAPKYGLFQCREHGGLFSQIISTHLVLDGEDKIAISDSVSTALFGMRNPAGQKITFQNGDKLTVTAVYRLPKAKSAVRPDYVLLSRTLPENRRGFSGGSPYWGSNTYQGLVLLRKGADPDKLEQEIFRKYVAKRFTASYLSQNHMSITEQIRKIGPNRFYLTRLDKARLEAKAVFRDHADVKNMKILAGLSLLILLISIINVINLKSAQASDRAKEIGVKKALGVSKKTIVFQLASESLTVCIASLILSLAFVEAVLPFLNKFLDKDIRLYYPQAYLVLAAAAALAAVVSGLVPAVYLSGFSPARTLKGNFSRSPKGIWLRNSILMLQLAISVFFISAAIAAYRQADFIMRRDLGFSGSDIAIINMQNGKYDYRKYEKIRSELKRIPGVADVSYGEASPLLGESSSSVSRGNRTVTAVHGAMDFNFFRFYGMRLVTGRELSPHVTDDTVRNAVVNEAFVKAFGLKGSRILNKSVMAGFSGDSLRIVGVLKDYSFGNSAYKTLPAIFLHYKSVAWKRNYMRTVLLKFVPGESSPNLDAVKLYWEKIEPGYPFRIQFVKNGYEEIYSAYRKQSEIVSFLTAIVIIVSLAGLFALSSLLLSQQRKNLAIKSTLGAKTHAIIWEFIRNFLPAIILSLIVGVSFSWIAVNRWLSNFDYHTSLGAWPFIFSCIVVLLLSVIVIAFQVYIRSRTLVLDDLKYE